MSKPLIVVLLLICSQFTHAGIISYNGYTLNEATNIVTNDATGLEWLQWDVTAGMSLNDALTNVARHYDGGSWRMATNSEVLNMSSTLLPSLSNWERQSVSDSLSSARFQRTSRSTSEFPNNWHFESEIDSFIELFGVTSNLGGPFINFAPNQMSLDDVLVSSALSHAGVLSVFDNGTSQGNSLFDGALLTTRISGGFRLSFGQSYRNSGIALVRSIPTEVSAPSTALLLFLSLTLFVRNASKVKRRS